MDEVGRITARLVAVDQSAAPEVAAVLRDAPEIDLVGPGGVSTVAVVVADRVDERALATVRGVGAGGRGPEVVLVATDLGPADAVRAVAAGARGLLRRREAGPRLTRTVLGAASGDRTIPPDLLGQLLQHRVAPAGPGLTDRERAVLRLVADGHETGEIARLLCYSARTVTGVLHEVNQRFRLRNRAHAVAYTLRAGLL